MSSAFLITLGVFVFLGLGWIGARAALNKIVPPETTD